MRPRPVPETLCWAIFPLSDLSLFEMPAAPRVDRPWQEKSRRNFLRCFGPVGYRSHDAAGAFDALSDWVAVTQGWYVGAGNFVRVPQPYPENCGAAGFRCAVPTAARLYADGGISAHLEIILSARRLDPAEDAAFSLGIARMPVALLAPAPPVAGHATRTKQRRLTQLNAIGAQLARRYAAAVRRLPSDPLQPVRSIDPLIIVQKQSPSLSMRWGKDVVTGGAPFRVLFLELGAIPSATARSIRRTVARLLTVTATIGQVRALVDRRVDPPPPGAVAELLRLVRQAQDGARALAEAVPESMDVLDRAIADFNREAVALGRLLHDRFPDGAFAGPANSLMLAVAGGPRAGAWLDEARLGKIAAAATAISLFDRRALLLSAMAPAVVGGLARDPVPAAQMALDLAALNRLSAAAGDPPLALWLDAAATLAANWPGSAAVFSDAAAEVRRLAGEGDIGRALP